MGKIKVFFAFLLFLLAGFLFFVGGFLTCYTVFPPSSQLSKTAWSANAELSSSDLTKGLMTPPPVNNDSQTYADRQALLRGTNPADQLITQTQKDARYQANQQAYYAASNTVSQFSAKIRSALGRYVGAAIAPVTQHLGQAAIKLALPSRSSSLSSSAQQGTLSKKTMDVDGKVVSPPVTSSASSAAHFTVQVQSFNTSEEALGLVAVLKERGFGAYVGREQTPTSLRFAVRVGQFVTYEEAQQGARLLNHETQLIVRVMMMEETNEPQ